MARKKRKDRLLEANHDRWLVSYADFITLLFAFFVVMYSISSVNEGKYRLLSETLNAAFGEPRGERGAADLAIVPGEPLRDLAALPADLPLARPAGESGELGELQQQIRQQAIEAMRQGASQQRVLDELYISLHEFIEQGLIGVASNGDRIEVDMKAQMLFSSGDARLSRNALEALRQVAQSLLSIANPVQVEGHTDNVPITNFLYRSNWELSAARAASVVRYLSEQGIDPKRLAAVAMGEHRPIADNASEQGRASNRRVTLLILGAEPELFEPDQIVPWAEGPAVEWP